MTRAQPHPPLTRRDAVVSAAILVASLVGGAMAWMPWHSMALGIVEVRGIERLEGRVLVTALGVSALLAGCHLLAGAPLLAWARVAATAVATGAAGVYVYVMARPESSIHELVRKVLEGTFRPGILVASVATVTALVLALSSLRRSP